MAQQREIWVYRVKMFACFFVVLGHFLQSMVASGFISDNELYQWFNATIYTFHVPLFFICSGYLYQKRTCVDSFAKWGSTLFKKLVALGIPYALFSFITWLLKSVFSSSVNYQPDGLLKTLFVNPVSPYWYLYVLFFMFVVFPTFDKKSECLIILAITVLLRCLGGSNIYVLSLIMEYGIWFVAGMVIAFCKVPSYVCKRKWTVFVGTLSGVLAIILSVVAFAVGMFSSAVGFLIGLLLCTSVLSVAIYIEPSGKGNAFYTQTAHYTMPLFLLHTIFAAGLRAVLIKVGIINPFIHITFGVIITFAGPIIVAELAKRIKPIDCLFNPNKYIFKINGDKNGTKA